MVPSSTFTSATVESELGEADHPPILAERQFELLPTSTAPVNPPMENPMMGATRERIYFDLRVGYRYDLGGSGFPSSTTGDSPTAGARLKAANDWRVIQRALHWPANWSALSNGDTIVRIAAPSARFDDAGDGLVIARATIEVEVSTNPATTRDVG